jgi:preprotein translocase SecF subunit
MDLIRKTNIDFVSKRNTFFLTSIILTVVGLALVAILGIDYGIDFLGGTQVTVEFKQNTATPDAVREAIGKAGYGGAEIKSFGRPGQYLIRVTDIGQDGGTTTSNNVVQALRSTFTNDDVVLLQSEAVEAKISSELIYESLLALFVAFVIMLVYVAFRFEFVFGLGAIVALLHDVLLAFAISVLFNKTGLLNLETSINSIAAYLTILGYSINDKVVVFDRVRENLAVHKGYTLSDVINLSLNETLSRTLITGVSVLVALLVLVLFGGEVLEGFAFTMFIGIVIGTYSSIYIASSFVIWYNQRVRHKNVGDVHTAATKA